MSAEEGPIRPGLRALQRFFATLCTDPDSIQAGLERAERELSLGVSDESALERVVTRGPRLSAAERLEIYRTGYRERLLECLADDYPALEFALGEAEFRALAVQYIVTYPSRSPSLNAYGRFMPELCAERAEPWAPFARELATLEWALVEAIHAAEASPLGAEALSALSPEQWAALRLVKSESLRVLRFEYPANGFFQAYRDGKSPALPGPGPSAVAVYRSGDTVWRVDLTDPMARVLGALASGAALGEALESLGADESVREEDVMRWFSEWISSGLFVALA